MTLKSLLQHLKKTEKIILVFLVLILVGSGYRVGKAFYLDNTEAEYGTGGVYTEGAVGEVSTLNPLFAQQGTVAQDLTELIFSGLTKFDTSTGEIVPDLATFKKSDDGKKYTFTLKDGVKWHDGKLLTSEDVIFTYEKVLKNPDFKGAALNYNDYSGIQVTKVDERTVEFNLQTPDAFFLAKTMIGLLPQHLLSSVPVNQLEVAGFNFSPVGSGPYRYVSTVNFPTHAEYGLEAFDGYYDKKPNLKSLVLKVFSNYQTLEKNLSTIEGLRSAPDELASTLEKKDQFILKGYELPQYVALFINNDSKKLEETNVRLALQLGTDKKGILESIKQKKMVDTPLLEINEENWTNQYSVKKANGALFETEWKIPNKDQLSLNGQDLEKTTKSSSPTAAVSYITNPNKGKDWKTSIEPITISGKAPKGAQSIWVGDYKLQKFDPGELQWDYVAAKKFDSLKSGKNVYEIYAEDQSGKKTLIDAITIEFEDDLTAKDSDNKERIEKENQDAPALPARENKKGEKLSLRLITSQNPPQYAQVAQLLKEQWKKIGVELQIEILASPTFEQRLAKRDYDLLLFGQNLGYNLDAYPYWHSSQANEKGLNFSQFKNFVVDSLLRQARLDDDAKRRERLKEIQEIIAQEVPAIFLYSPTYYTALSKDIQYPELKHLATTSDRLASLPEWSKVANRKFKEEVNIFTFFSWAAKQL